jgi:hypothetical protein
MPVSMPLIIQLPFSPIKSSLPFNDANHSAGVPLNPFSQATS